MNPNKVLDNGLVAHSILVLMLALMLFLLRTLGPQESLKPGNMQRHGPPPAEAPPPDAEQSRPFVNARDTINGERITDRILIARIERIAAGLPSLLLADHPAGAGVRYLAHGFGPGDDAPIFYGEFQEAAAALAFGCALDEDLAERCALTSIAAAAAYEELPGVHCVPLRLALGAPSYEPDRCAADG